jgi:[ribosomal protein S5]-alanine N-acetyltransferase
MEVKLETERLILRKPKISDANELKEGLNDLQISKYLAGVKHPYSQKDAKDWIKHCLKEWKKRKKETYFFFIELKSEKKLIGAIDIKKAKEWIGVTGSWINKNYHRKGYISEAKIAINEFAFNELKLKKLETETGDDNLASQLTQEAMGYKKEGIRLKHLKSLATGKIHDAHLYGLFKKDWKKNLPKLKKHLENKIRKLK